MKEETVETTTILDMNSSKISTSVNRVYLLSTIIQILLAILGYGLEGIHLFNMDIFPYIIYFILVHAPLTAIYLIRYRVLLLNMIDIYSLVLFIFMIFSTLWVTNSSDAMISLGVFGSSMAIGLFISVTANSLFVLRNYVIIIKIAVVSVLVLTFTSAVLDIQLFGSYWFDNSTLYSSAWYSNRNDFSYVLSISSPLFLVPLFDSSSTIRREISELFVFIMISTIILLNESRAAFGSQIIIALSALYIWYSINAYSNNKDSTLSKIYATNRKFTAISLASLPILFCIFIFVPNPFAETPMNSLATRWNLHKGGFYLAVDNLLGVGVGNFKYSIGTLGFKAGSIGPHSWYSLLVGEFGFIGIFIFLILYGRLLDFLYKCSVYSENSLSAVMFISLISFSLSAMSPANVFHLQIHWIIFGISISITKLVKYNKI